MYVVYAAGFCCEQPGQRKAVARAPAPPYPAPLPGQEVRCVQPPLVASEEDSRDDGAEEGDDDEARDAQHPGQGTVLPLVASGLGLKLPSAGDRQTASNNV